jgi:NRAMP (natural resistance-associated macrophage protein)-like metal ion transporter
MSATAPAERPPKPTRHALVRWIGPGVLTGASDDDPSGIGTYSQVGAQFGFALLWTMLFSYPLMVAVQLICARIGRVTGHGLAGNLRHHLPKAVLLPLIALLLLANTINIGADLGAMGAAMQLLFGGSDAAYTVVFGVASVLLQVFVPYKRYVAGLQWLTLALLAYVATAFVLRVPWSDVLGATLMPRFALDRASLTAIVAVLGTTISPYLFFWQASQEVEELKAAPDEQPLKRAPRQAERQLHRIGVDTYAGMGVSNLVAWFIILTAAATLHRQGMHEIASAADAARALEPVAGRLAAAVFALGIVGTGLLAVPVLAGSAAYGLGEAMHWRIGLENKPARARGFYAVIAGATLAGVAMNFAHVNPIRALYWTAVINGVIAVPILAAVMVVASRRSLMGKFAITGRLKALGWLATVLMAACALALALV